MGIQPPTSYTPVDRLKLWLNGVQQGASLSARRLNFSSAFKITEDATNNFYNVDLAGGGGGGGSLPADVAYTDVANAWATAQNLPSGSQVNSDIIATLVAVQTLTHKDLTDVTNTFPTTLATLTGAQALTHKDLTDATNTFPASIVKNNQNNNLGAFYEDIQQIAAPASPAANTLRLYVDSGTGHISVKNSSGTVVDLEAGGAVSNPMSPANGLWSSCHQDDTAWGAFGPFWARNTVTGTVTGVQSQTLGFYRTYLSATACGVYPAGTVRRLAIDGNPYFWAKAIIPVSAWSNLQIGLTSGTTPTSSTTDPCANLTAAVIGARSTDTNWQLITNNGGASSTYTSMGLAIDTSMHTFELFLTAATNVVGKIDGAHTTTVTSPIPAAGVAMTPEIAGYNSTVGIHSGYVTSAF